MLIVFGVSVLIMLIQTRFQSHIFLVDDNAVQFHPVIDQVYSSFMRSGRLAFYDFFQMKGMTIGDEGYYCQTNILMFLSWGLTKCILRSFDCITLYGIICTVMGNWGWNCLFKQMKISLVKRLFVITMGTTVSAFVWFGYWFYAFNSYIVIPFLLLLLYREITTQERRNYFSAGLLLFFSLTLGNVQYTVYHYMIFGLILFLYIFITKRYEKTRYLFSNILVGGILSAPILLNQLNASARRKEFIFAEDFFLRKVSFIRWIFNALLPAGLLEEHPILHGLSAYGNYHQQFMPGVVICCGIFICYLLKKAVIGRREKKTAAEYREMFAQNIRAVFVACVFFSTLFFWLFQCGKGYIVADVISHIPVINQFRLLYKLALVIAPLSIVVVAFVIDRNWRAGRWIAVFSIVLGIYNNRFITTGHGFWMYEDNMKKMVSGVDNYDELETEMESNGIDLANFRLLGMSSEENSYGEDHYEASFLGANYPTLFGCYALGGYEIALMKENYASVSELFRGYVDDYAISGQVKISDLVGVTEEGQIWFQNGFIPQMKENAVKYCLFREDSKEQYLFHRILREGYGMDAEVITLSNGFRIYVLDAERICDGADVEKNGLIDQLTFHIDENFCEDFLRIRFSYNKDLKAYWLDDGRKKEIPILRDDNGDIKIVMEQAMRGKELVIRYGNIADHLVLYYGMLGSLVVLSMLLVGLVWNKRKQEKEAE